MKIEKHSLILLGPVVESAREELADMEDDDVLAGMRRVARSSARRLPPPLARSVIEELTRSESFRTAVAERYQQHVDTDGDLVAFLDDPASGLARINDRALEMTNLEEQSEVREARRTIDKLTGQLEEAHRRLVATRTVHERELKASRVSVSEREARLEARVEMLGSEVAAKQEEIVALVADVSELTAELASTEEKVRRAVERSRKRGSVVGNPARDVRPDSAPSDPVDLARWLDSVERNIRPFRSSEFRGHDVEDAQPFQMEQGIAPDSGVAISSLLEQGPDRFILDGYNIAGEIHNAEFSTRSARDDVVHRAGRLARCSEAEILVVFDGQDDQANSGFRTTEGVTVRFSRGEKADDVIAALVADETMRTVVITNDRELRDRCIATDCVPIWSTAFIEWLAGD